MNVYLQIVYIFCYDMDLRVYRMKKKAIYSFREKSENSEFFFKSLQSVL